MGELILLGIGFVVGGLTGIVITCLCVVSRDRRNGVYKENEGEWK